MKASTVIVTVFILGTKLVGSSSLEQFREDKDYLWEHALIAAKAVETAKEITASKKLELVTIEFVCNKPNLITFKAEAVEPVKSISYDDKNKVISIGSVKISEFPNADSGELLELIEDVLSIYNK